MQPGCRAARSAATVLPSVLAIALAAACGGGDDDTADAGTDIPDGAMNADGAPGTPDAPVGTPDGAPGCGTEELPVGMITDTEGLAIAADGTLYYSQAAAVGRRRPGMPPENNWVALPGAGTVWGLALSGDDTKLYAASPSTRIIYQIDVTAASPAATTLHAAGGSQQPNGLVVGPDDAVYYSDISGDRVYRVDASGMRTQVTTSTINSANGLLFDPDGTLLVLSYGPGQIFRLTLDAAMVETARVMVGSVPGAALDGIARDAEGRYYVSDNGNGELIRLDSAFANPETLLTGVGAAANIVWGKGALDCHDVYVASSGSLALFHADTTGLP